MVPQHAEDRTGQAATHDVDLRRRWAHRYTRAVRLSDPTRDPTAIETEILQERVATLVRIASTLGSHLEELYRVRESVVSAPPEERPERVGRFRELRSLVDTWYWYLIVQREANGLLHHHGLEEHYRIPSLPPPPEMSA